MGREIVELRATAAVSKHNSSQDDKDAVDWDLFVARVKRLASQSNLDIDVSATWLEPHGWR